MIANLAALTLHEQYTTSNSVIIGDGIGLSIANIGSFTLPSLPTLLFFTSVLHVPVMSKNFISISAFYTYNPINVLFFYSFFHVQDRHMGVTLVHRQHRDIAYY